MRDSFSTKNILLYTTILLGFLLTIIVFRKFEHPSSSYKVSVEIHVDDQDDSKYVHRLARRLSSDENLNKIIEVVENLSSPSKSNKYLPEYQKNVSIKKIRKKSQIRINVIDVAPRKAASIAQAIAASVEELDINVIDSKKEGTSQIDKIEDYQRLLTSLEDNLAKFLILKFANEIALTVENRAAIIKQNLINSESVYTGENLDVKSNLEKIEAIYKEEIESDHFKNAPINVMSHPEVIGYYLVELATLDLDRMLLINEFDIDHPMVQSIDEQIVGIKKQYVQKIKESYRQPLSLELERHIALLSRLIKLKSQHIVYNAVLNAVSKDSQQSVDSNEYKTLESDIKEILVGIQGLNK